ncbi:hypothetical protein Pst134EA_017728 [Puccinia striiformis f. sp. tritici]|uniref:hypothetical protein n=1 Tax=Puccinia striiformis f. sp. tritici TaxID=168172 RepID=UPI0020076193|nr:hypothetical protein Pst134EA_017728 [Puccinia striiformis f. sp. tritici]KAH9461419.1 hypothetical protein Pst134EA_017728 [Puccinia striiformis f. sp. tritici]
MDHLTFEEAIIADSLPTDLTPGDYTIFKEIDDIRSDDVAGVVEDDYVPALPTIPPSLKFNGLRPRGWLQRLNVRLDLRLRSGAQPFHRRSIVALKSRHFSPDCSPPPFRPLISSHNIHPPPPSPTNLSHNPGHSPPIQPSLSNDKIKQYLLPQGPSDPQPDPSPHDQPPPVGLHQKI